ncbi:hypothetical protein [Streptomyces seoulensis]|uniref:hypothetical protein n=1 Tax=Streptomyces seoulensis TaxID=73044 RepID=UPI001FCC03BE|nr:hypothetical protein [Streptomyces seoulensis]BDH07221.1 hypothetical protein HEK131_44480 [Streptomyces seoulensis]
MSHPSPDPLKLADEITRQLGRLADRLSQLPPSQATQVIARVLDADNGVFGGITHLMITGSRFAKDQAERGELPAEVWLALGRAANMLDDMVFDLDEHQDTLRRISTQPTTIAATPPAPVPLVVRRRR